MPKATLFMRSFDVDRDFHPSASGGHRYAANFQIQLSGAAQSKILLIVSWNATQSLIKGTNNTETKVTAAGISIAKTGVGWAEVSDIAGEEAWVDFSSRVIRFTKRFTVSLPVAPALAGVPVVGEAVKDLGATNNWRVECEGFLDVVSYVGNLKAVIY